MARHHIIATAILTVATAIPAGTATAATSVERPAPQASTDRFVTIEGTRFRVRDEGPRDAPPIVLIHGFTFSLESWDGWAADLARDHRVIRFDLAGHGLSGPDSAGNYGTTVRLRQFRKLLDHLAIPRATIAGNSFGGLVAWTFAALHPRRVDRLILVDSAAFSINGVTEKPVAVPAAMRSYLLDPQPAGIAYSAASIFAHPDRLGAERLALMRTMIARNGPALVAHLEQFTLPDPRPLLRRIEAPTLILWGKADKLIPVAQANQIAAEIPDAKLIIYDDVGHAPQEEASAASVTDVRAFLNNDN